MPKDYNRELDQSTEAERRKGTSSPSGTPERPAPDHDAQTARERQGEGFKNPADAYSETGARGAGYRATREKKS